MNNLCCWLVTCRPGTSVLVTVVERPIWPAHAAACRRRANAYVAGRTKPAVGRALPPASPTGHPFVSLTGHQSCRGTDSPESPPATIPPGSENRIMHASFRIGETELMASDGLEQ